MKTTALLLTILLGISNLNLAAADVIEVTSVPIAMNTNGKTDIEIPASPPAGWRIEKIIVVLGPIIKVEPNPLILKPFSPELLRPSSLTNQVQLPKLQEPKEKPLFPKGPLRNLTLGEPKHPDGEPKLIRVGFRF